MTKSLRSELKADIAAVRSELAEFRGEVREEFRDVRTGIGKRAIGARYGDPRRSVGLTRVALAVEPGRSRLDVTPESNGKGPPKRALSSCD